MTTGNEQRQAQARNAVQTPVWPLGFGVFLIFTPYGSVQSEKLTIIGRELLPTTWCLASSEKDSCTPQGLTTQTSQKAHQKGVVSTADGGAPRAADPPVCQKLPQKVCLALPGLQASQDRLEIQIFIQNNSTNIDLVPAMGGLCSKCFLHVR